MLNSFFKPFFPAFFFLSTLLLINANTALAQKTFSGTGDWSDGSKWSPAGVPSSTDIVLIASGATLTVDVSATCDSLFFIANSTGNSTVNINTGITFTVTNNVRYTDPATANRTQTINVGAGNFVCNTISFANTSANSEIDRLLLSTGNITINGNMVMDASAVAENQVVCSGSGTIELKGAWTGSFYTYTSATSTFIYNSSSLQNIRTATYNKLILASGNKVPNGNVITNDSLIIRPGATLTNSGNVSLTLNSVYYIEGSYQETSTQGNVTLIGLIHITATGIFQSTVGEAFAIRNGIKNDGTFISGSGTYTFATNSQSLSGSKMFTFAGAVTVTGVTLTNDDSLQITGTLGGTGTLVNDAGSYLRLNAATTTITALTTSGAENWVVFGRANVQTIPAQAYENLSFIGSNVKTAAGNVTVNDELNIASGVTFALSTFTLTTGMGFSNTGTGTLSTANVSATPIPAGLTWLSAVSYNSASAQTIVDGVYSSLNGTGGNRTLSPTGTIFISGTYTVGAGTYSVANSTVNFNGTGSQTIPASAYFHLTSSSSGARTLAAAGTIFIAGTFTPGTNTYTVTGSTIDFNNGANLTIPAFGYNNLAVSDGFVKTIPGNLTLSGNLTLTSGKLALGSNTLTLNGTVTSSATSYLVSNGSSNITFAGTGSTSFFLDPTIDGTSNRIETFIVNRGTSTVTMGNTMYVNTALTLTAGRIAPGSNTLLLNGTLTSSATNYIIANGSSNITITGTGNMTLFLDQTTNNTTNRLGTLLFNRSGSSLTLGNSLQANTALTLTNGQLVIGGNTLTLNGTVTSSSSNNFIANGSSIISYGGTGNAALFLDQTTPGTTNRLATLTINRAGNVITQGNELRIARLVLTAGQIAIGSNSLIISSTAANILGAAMSASNNIICNGSSSLSVITSDNVNVTNPVLFFDQGNDGVTNKLANFIVNLGNSSRSLSLGNNLYVETALTLTRGDLGIGSNTLTINGTLTNDASNFLIANGSSNLTFGNTGNISLFLSITTPGTTNSIATLIFNRAGNVLTMGSALHSATALTLTNGQLALGSNLLTINGTLTSSASNNFIANGLSTLSFTGSGNASLFLDQSVDNTTNRLAALTVNRSGNVITQNGNMRTARLTLTAGQLAIGSNTLFINSTAANILGAAMNSSNNLRCNGSSNLFITTSDNTGITNGTLFFDQTTPGTTNRLAAFTVNLGGNTRFLGLGSDLQVNAALTLAQGDLAIGSNTLSINGGLTNSANNLLIANGSSSIEIAGSGALGSSLFLDQSIPGTTNRLANLTYNRATQTITLQFLFQCIV
ncbi:MAG: hypothetical protein V4658_05340 [Bacteroidota bacterium]